jgi:hypothetical protein
MNDQTDANERPADADVRTDQRTARTHAPVVRKRPFDPLPNVLLGCILLLLVAAVSTMFGGPVRDLVESRVKASPTDYADMAHVAGQCPATAEAARAAMADGRLNQLEVRRVARIMYRSADEALETRERALASAANGGPRIRITPECSTWDGGSEYNLSSPMFYGYRSMANFR